MATARRSTARQSTATKAPAKRTGQDHPHRSATKKSPARRTAAKESSADPTDARRTSSDKPVAASRDHAPEDAPRRRRPRSMRTLASRAASELTGLIGRQVEGVVGVEQVDDGWRVQVEVVETRRIPETTDILATYEVDVDADGEVTAYRRLSRHVRGRFKE
jgi:Gas vesicle synthesis protein GvpO